MVKKYVLKKLKKGDKVDIYNLYKNTCKKIR